MQAKLERGSKRQYQIVQIAAQAAKHHRALEERAEREKEKRRDRDKNSGERRPSRS